MLRPMRRSHQLASLLALTLVAVGPSAPAQQPRALTDAECRALRQRLAGHARLSDGVRRAVASLAAAAPATPSAPPTTAPAASSPATAPAGRAEAIRARLEQTSRERQILEDQRLAAVVRFDLARASQIQTQIQGLDTERANLERELASLPATPAPAAPPAPGPAASTPPSDVDRLRCQDLPGALEAAVKARQRELGAREGQAGVIPLLALQGQSPDQIASELAGQFAAWPDAEGQVGLLDQDGNGRLDAFVDAPAPDVFRLYRQRSDGTLSVETFVASARASSPGVGEVTRRIEETVLRGSGAKLEDLLAARPAGPARTVGESADFVAAHAALLAGAFADAAKVDAAAARTREFPNYRGETVRVLDVIVPTTGGVAHRRLIVTPRPSNQEQWDDATTVIRPVSFWRTDVEVTGGRDVRAAGGAAGARTAITPLRFSVER